MHTSDYVRTPKPNLNHFIAYLGTTLTCTISIVLSVLLFWSISESFYFSCLFAALAISFELAKFMALAEIGHRWRCENKLGSLTATLLFLVLAGTSILGSIGGLNSDTEAAKARLAEIEQQRSGLQLQIKSLQSQIEQNNKAIERYIELNRIKNYAQPLQTENQKLREEISGLQKQLNTLPEERETSMLAMLHALATAFKVDVEKVQAWSFIVLSVLLDVVAGFCINLVREENDFRRQLKLSSSCIDNNQLSATESVTQNATENATELDSTPLMESRVEVEEQENTEHKITNIVAFPNASDERIDSEEELYEELKEAISSGATKPSQREAMRKHKIGSARVKAYFERLESEGLLIRQDNGRYMHA